MKTSNILAQVVPDIRRMNNKSQYPLKLRITYKRERKYYGTGYSLTTKDWETLNNENCKGKLRTIKNEIAGIEKGASEFANKLSPFTFENFQDGFFKKTNAVSIPDFVF